MRSTAIDHLGAWDEPCFTLICDYIDFRPAGGRNREITEDALMEPSSCHPIGAQHSAAWYEKWRCCEAWQAL